MTRLFASSLRLALILIQFLAPWVHAHAERETGGLFHIPGLERWRDGEGSAAAGTYPAEPADHIAGMQQGFTRGVSGLTVPDEHAMAGLSPTHRFQQRPLLSTRMAPLGLAPPVVGLYFRSGSPPRASPTTFPSCA